MYSPKSKIIKKVFRCAFVKKIIFGNGHFGGISRFLKKNSKINRAR